MVSAVVWAAKPGLEDFSATGNITYISEGKVLPAGKTGKWVVVDREIKGEFDSGNLSGPYTMNYHAMIESLDTQAGDLHGTLVMDDGSRVLKVKGRIESVEQAGWYVEPSPPDFPGIPYLMLTMSDDSEWWFTAGTWGRGTFGAWAKFVPTAEGHVWFIEDSSFNMYGEWQP